jgi:hypothetical protein
MSEKYQEDEKIRAVFHNLVVLDAYNRVIKTLTSDANSESTLE